MWAPPWRDSGRTRTQNLNAAWVSRSEKIPTELTFCAPGALSTRGCAPRSVLLKFRYAAFAATDPTAALRRRSRSLTRSRAT
jgi:hypothetical protein